MSNQCLWLHLKVETKSNCCLRIFEAVDRRDIAERNGVLVMLNRQEDCNIVFTIFIAFLMMLIRLSLPFLAGKGRSV